METIKHYKEVKVKIDLLDEYTKRLYEYEAFDKSGNKLNLTDDDTLSDYVASLFGKFLKENNLSYKDLDTLIVGNNMIQQSAFTPHDISFTLETYKYELIED